MNRNTSREVDRFEELYDRDIETLLSGGIPANTDLIPLCDFISDLRSMADVPLSDAFIKFHAAESAASAARAHAQNPRPNSVGRSRGIWAGIRRRVTASAMSLIMLFGATGMAMAADDAVPGDWNYGLDRALEAIGIGAGGAAERAEELEVLASEGSTENEDADGPGQTSPSLDSSEESTGLNRAAAVISEPSPGSGQSLQARARVAEMLLILNDVGGVDGGTVSDIARDGAGRPEGSGPPGGEPPGRGVANGQDGGAGAKPDNPGKGSPPESPGKSSRP
jgi:hypothetical protein